MWFVKRAVILELSDVSVDTHQMMWWLCDDGKNCPQCVYLLSNWRNCTWPFPLCICRWERPGNEANKYSDRKQIQLCADQFTQLAKSRNNCRQYSGRYRLMWKMLCPTLSTWFAHSDQFLYCYMQKNAAIVFNPSAIDSSVNMTASLQRWSVNRFSHSYLMSFFILHVSEPGISKLCTTLQLPSGRVWRPEEETLTSTSTNRTIPLYTLPLWAWRPCPLYCHVPHPLSCNYGHHLWLQPNCPTQDALPKWKLQKEETLCVQSSYTKGKVLYSVLPVGRPLW